MSIFSKGMGMFNVFDAFKQDEDKGKKKKKALGNEQ